MCKILIFVATILLEFKQKEKMMSIELELPV